MDQPKRPNAKSRHQRARTRKKRRLGLTKRARAEASAVNRSISVHMEAIQPAASFPLDSNDSKLSCPPNLLEELESPDRNHPPQPVKVRPLPIQISTLLELVSFLNTATQLLIHDQGGPLQQRLEQAVEICYEILQGSGNWTKLLVGLRHCSAAFGSPHVAAPLFEQLLSEWHRAVETGMWERCLTVMRPMTVMLTLKMRVRRELFPETDSTLPIRSPGVTTLAASGDTSRNVLLFFRELIAMDMIPLGSHCVQCLLCYQTHELRKDRIADITRAREWKASHRCLGTEGEQATDAGDHHSPQPMFHVDSIADERR